MKTILIFSALLPLTVKAHSYATPVISMSCTYTADLFENNASKWIPFAPGAMALASPETKREQPGFNGILMSAKANLEDHKITMTADLTRSVAAGSSTLVIDIQDWTAGTTAYAVSEVSARGGRAEATLRFNADEGKVVVVKTQCQVLEN